MMINAIKQLSVMMIIRWHDVPTSEHYFKVMVYSIICKHHSRYASNGNKNEAFPGIDVN